MLPALQEIKPLRKKLGLTQEELSKQVTVMEFQEHQEKYYPEEGPGCSGWGLFLQIL
mgnify:CR=1 FL=1